MITYINIYSRPVKIKDGLFACDGNPGQLDTIRRQASSDWKQFVLNRGKELKPGELPYIEQLTFDDMKIKIYTDELI